MNVPDQYQEVHLDSGKEPGSNLSELRQAVETGVAEMENAIAFKGVGKVWERY